MTRRRKARASQKSEAFRAQAYGYEHQGQAFPVTSTQERDAARYQHIGFGQSYGADRFREPIWLERQPEPVDCRLLHAVCNTESMSRV